MDDRWKVGRLVIQQTRGKTTRDSYVKFLDFYSGLKGIGAK